MSREIYIKVLMKVKLPTELTFDTEKVLSAMEHDKKVAGEGSITVTVVNEAGCFELITMPVSELKEKIRENLSK